MDSAKRVAWYCAWLVCVAVGLTIRLPLYSLGWLVGWLWSGLRNGMEIGERRECYSVAMRIDKRLQAGRPDLRIEPVPIDDCCDDFPDCDCEYADDK